MVGCVIVHNNKIIGEGYTSDYGGSHAEVNTINSVKNKKLLRESTLYVTLEPCSHFGKTPPCSDLIINYKIPSIVIGCIDDNEKVAGKGVKKLRDAGCNVIVGILETTCRAHHKRFFTFHNKKRPYIILKWAETIDGFIAPKTKNEKKPIWITNEFSRQLVHKWRTEEHGILVGTNTILEDNPSLTARDWIGKNPVRVVIDKEEKLSKNLTVFNDESETIILTDKNIDFSQNSAKEICDVLFKNEITSVIIEGGTKTLQTFINANLWDEARVFTGENNLKEGIRAPKFSGKIISEEKILTDILKIYKND